MEEKTNKLNIGLIGLGVVGGSLYNWLKNNTQHNIYREDPGKGFNEIEPVKKDINVFFVCVPVPTNKNGIQDTIILKNVLKKYREHKRVPFFIRSTILPKTTDHLKKFLKMNLYAMPEFLVERESDKTFESQGIICGCDLENTDLYNNQEDLLKKIFPNKKIILMTNREAELAKFAHNCMGALKVNFFNLIAKYSETITANYSNVLEGVLMSGYINAEHTRVPGPDGKHGFGGNCFLKDMFAFIKELKRIGLQSSSLECVMFENTTYRQHWDKWLKVPEVKFPEEYKTGE